MSGRAPLATVTDLEERLGEPFATSAAGIQAYARLQDASEIVRAYAGATWLDDDGDLADVPPAVAGVVCAMVERAVRNPGGITQETAGPFSRSFGADAATRLWLTKAERSVVRSAIGRAGVAPLATTRGDLETSPVLDEWTITVTDSTSWAGDV